MSLWSRLTNLFRGDGLSRDIDEELQSHLDEAVEHGRDPDEARRAFGSRLRWRDQSHDLRLIPWLDSLRADAIFGWRQLAKKKTISAAAILSLGLAIGACTAAFRLIDAVLWRPLPVANADRLYSISHRGQGPSGDFRISDSSEYPLFRRMRAAAQGQAELIAVSYADRVDLTYSSDDDMEKAHRQYVSGWMFNAFGIQPAAGRLFTEADDSKPGAHPYAVLSYDYWARRFGKDPKAVGRTFRIGNDLYEIIGVAAAPFTGTEPGIVTDVFIPTMMNPYVQRSDASWFRPFAIVHPGVAVEPLRAKLDAVMRAFNEERASTWSGQTKLFLDRFLNQTLLLEPAASGVSGLQKDYRRALIVMDVLVALVLLIACANIANLMSAQATAREREMALRVSIGAGRRRLVQLILVESAWLGILSAVVGATFAWWAAPFVVSRINPPDNPARLALPTDWRVLGFAVALTFAVTLLFGLAPALRASAVRPASALRGGDNPHSRRRLMLALIAVQVAFCFVVHFAAGLFVNTFERLANQPTGFSSAGVLDLETVTRHLQPPAAWNDVIEHLRTLPGIESVGLAGWPLLGGNGWNGFVWVNGEATEVLAYFLAVSPDWRDTMKIRLLDGRDLRPDETSPGAALVNEAFVKECFHGKNPIGSWFEKESGDGATRIRFQVVGVVADARYRNMREPITPTAYVPFYSKDDKGVLRAVGSGTIVVRTSSGNPAALAPMLRQEVSRARHEFRVSNLRTQKEINEQHTVRERLLAMLSLFFAGVALLLAAVGVYGVLDYSVLQRQREIGIRVAIGAPAADIIRRVAADVFAMVAIGAVAGLAIGMSAQRYIETLLYQVKGSDPTVALVPAVVIAAAAILAAVPGVVRALRIDPVGMLRAE